MIKKHDLNDASEKEQIAAVRKDSRAIKYIDNPSKKIQRLAIKKLRYHLEKHHTCVMAYIKNPSEEIQRLAVQQEGQSIHCIDNPSLKIQRLAIRQSCCAITGIKNPSDEIQKLAIKRYKKTVRYKFIKNLSKKVQEWFINLNRRNIFEIPTGQLDKQLANKYRYLLSMRRAGILS